MSGCVCNVECATTVGWRQRESVFDCGRVLFGGRVSVSCRHACAGEREGGKEFGIVTLSQEEKENAFVCIRVCVFQIPALLRPSFIALVCLSYSCSDQALTMPLSPGRVSLRSSRRPLKI